MYFIKYVFFFIVISVFLFCSSDKEDCTLAEDNNTYTVFVDASGTASFCGYCVSNCSATMTFAAAGNYTITLEQGNRTYTCGGVDKSATTSASISYTNDSSLITSTSSYIFDYGTALGYIGYERSFTTTRTIQVTDEKSFKVGPSESTLGAVCEGAKAEVNEETPYRVRVALESASNKRYVLETHSTANSDTATPRIRVYTSNANTLIECNNGLFSENATESTYAKMNCALASGTYYANLRTSISFADPGAYSISLRDTESESSGCGKSSGNSGGGSTANSAENTDDTSSTATTLNIGRYLII